MILLLVIIEFVRDQLREVSEMRSEKNIYLLNIRFFRSNVIRHQKREEKREDKNNITYCTTQKIIEKMKSKILIIYQCETVEIDHDFAQRIFFSIIKCDHISIYELCNDNNAIVIYNLYSIYVLKYAHNLDSIISRLRQVMIKFTFL